MPRHRCEGVRTGDRKGETAMPTPDDAPAPDDPGRPDAPAAGASGRVAGLVGRRRALAVIAGAGASVALAACGSGGGDSATGTTTSTTGPDGPDGPPPGGGSGGTGDGEGIPEETAGPFPGDGSNGPNLLTQDGAVRRDIRSSFGSGSATAKGVPLTIELTVLDAASGDPLPGAAVYAWQCDREGRYSMYSAGVENENYLRGVQEADDRGRLSFESIFPGAYPGRWPHVHFEVYPDLATATSAGTPATTSQLALPEDACAEVYATDGYDQSVTTMTSLSLDTDMVFSDDGAAEQLATMSGSVSRGLVAALDVPV
jgi:protocatechuate 3,4-dioxygenase beta subunit